MVLIANFSLNLMIPRTILYFTMCVKAQSTVVVKSGAEYYVLLMTAGATFEKLRVFLESKPASKKAIRHLKSGVEISVVIGNQIECALFQIKGEPKFEQRPAKSPDVAFFIKPESVDIISKEKGEDVGELGIAILKEYLSGGIRIKVPGSIIGLTTHGYVGIIKEGGATFAKFLAQHGITNISKIMSAIRNLKNSA